jgi:hypothetical protein
MIVCAAAVRDPASVHRPAANASATRSADVFMLCSRSQQGPQAIVPSGHVVGAAPRGQLTSHAGTLVHVTWQSPVQSASHVDAFVQEITLPAPARTPHVDASWHVKLQLSPQMVAHVVMLKQVILQSFPQDDVHVFMSWQVSLHALLQTRPQVSPMLSHSWLHPSPVHPRSHSLPPEQAQICPGSQPSVV